MTFLEKSSVAFSHLYLLNWTPAYETLPYPPASGPYAVYTIPDFYKTVDYVQSRVSTRPAFFVVFHVLLLPSLVSFFVAFLLDSSTCIFLQYNDTERIAIGTYHFNKTDDTKWNVTLCNTHYEQGKIYAFNSTYFYDKSVRKSECVDAGCVRVN